MMRRPEELEIEIDPSGQVRVHVKGMGGRRCLEYVDVFRALLGPVTNEQVTPEFFETEITSPAFQERVQQQELFRRR